MPSWRYRVSLWCFVLRHAEPLWHCGTKGNEWCCPDCQRKTPSALKHLGPFGI